MTMISRMRTQSLVIIPLHADTMALHKNFQVGCMCICIVLWFSFVVWYSAGGYTVGASSSCQRLLIGFWYVQPHFHTINSVHSLQYTMGFSKLKDVLLVLPLCCLHEDEEVNPCFRSPIFSYSSIIWFWKDLDVGLFNFFLLSY